MSLEQALSVSRTGLAATQRALALISQNIANADTPGYTRKTLPLGAEAVGDMPLGVRMGEARRDVDAVLVARADASLSEEAAATLRETLLQGIEQTQSIGDGAVPDAIAALRDSLIALRAQPADGGLQRAAVDAAGKVVRNLNAVSDAIGGARQQAQDAILQEVASVNASLRQIAALTIRIQGGLEGEEAAALEDERDRAVARLSESIAVRVVRQADDRLLLLANGTMELPLDPDRDPFSVADAAAPPGAWYGPGGALPGIMMGGTDVTAWLGGGRLGEAVALRDRTLPRMQAELDLVATTLAGRLDAQGLRLFTDTGGAAPPAMTGGYPGSAQIGFAGRIAVNPAVAGDARLLRDGTQAVAATPGGPDAFTPNPAGGPAGFTTLLDRVLAFSFGTEAAAGTAWAAIPNGGLGPDGSLASGFRPPAAIADYATRVMAGQAADRSAATGAREDAAALRAALAARLQQRSGVDVDAELGAMVALQNAYAANARVLGTVQTMWDQLLAAVR